MYKVYQEVSTMKKIYLLLVVLFFLASSGSLNASVYFHQNTIKGKVVDDHNQPLPGVSVRLENGKGAVVTDGSGAFTIMANMKDILIFTFTGMIPKRVTIERTFLTVTMKSSQEELQEVVVTGYETIDKRMFTGASQNLKMADIKVEGTTDISRMLQGRAAGVNIQNVSGTFGSAPKITIRGGSSILGQTSPLWVIDGVVREDIVEQSFNDLTSGNATTLIGSSLAGINTSDIDKIDVLRDAAATSLYGARALNGVIVITTKKGKKNAPVAVNYNNEFSMRTIPSYDNFDILNSYESMGMLKEELEKGFYNMSDIAGSANSGVLGIAYRKMGIYDEASQSFQLKNTPQDLNRFLQTYEKANTNWFQTLFKNSISQTHSFSFSGGGDKNTYYASLGYLHDPGWTVGEKVDQLTVNLKNTFFFSDKVDLTLSMLGSIRDQQAPGTFDSQNDTYYGKVTRDFDINPFGYAISTSRMLRPKDNNGNLEYYTANFAPFNILNELDNNKMDIGVKDFQFQADFKYKITSKIDFSTVGSARFFNSTREHKVYEGSNTIMAYNAASSQQIRNSNRFLYTDLDKIGFLPISALENGGIYKKTDNSLLSYYVRNSLHYADRINDTHDIDVLAAQEVRFVNRESPQFTGYGIQYDRGYVPFTDPHIIEKVINEGQSYFNLDRFRERTVAFLIKTTYGYKNRYFASFSGRYDGSNRQGESPKSRWIPTWTLSAKWNVMEETFMQKVKSPIWSDFQVRYSYGLTANTGPATNAYAIFTNAISTNRRQPDTRESILDITALRNADLTWEKQYASNLGVDLGFFSNNLTLSVEAYQNKSFDLIDNVQVGGIGGELEKSANNADMKTRGLEVTLSSNNIHKKDFTWTSAVNFSVYHQEITKIKLRPNVFDLVTDNGGNIIGKPRNSLYSLDFRGLNDQGLPQFNIGKDGKEDITIKDVDMQDRDKITDYLKYEGAVDPNLTVGFSNTFRYKNWNFSFFLYGSAGNKMRLKPIYSDSYSESFVPSRDFVNRWLLPGDENKTNIPVIPDKRLRNQIGDLERAYNAYNFSTERVANGSYIRVRNIALGYNLPSSLLGKYHLTNVALRVAATNPFLLYSDSKLNGADPEFFDTGGVALPIPKQYILSLIVGF
ncbi:TonB-linked outer membrane protein, SusC/RagA family [bacterium A37T11]|nr:TonB-linked outer membrane protein, SusC/RagA family [bacterium A37T11]